MRSANFKGSTGLGRAKTEVAFTWTPEQIRWYENASDFVSFHRQLAGLLIPYLRPTDRVCNWGCGLGRLSQELAAHVSHITCIDSDQAVLASLQRRIKEERIDNITTLLGDAWKIEEACDLGLMVFFGKPVELMARCLDHSSRLLIRVVNAGRREGPAGGESVQELEKFLSGKGYPYELLEASFEFGQPFSSLEDALAFMEFHKPSEEGEEGEIPVGDKLIPAASKRFPYYLPKRKDLAIFLIDTARGKME